MQSAVEITFELARATINHAADERFSLEDFIRTVGASLVALRAKELGRQGVLLPTPTVRRPPKKSPVYTTPQPTTAPASETCLVCGRVLKWVNNFHVEKMHGMNLKEYREKYGL